MNGQQQTCRHVVLFGFKEGTPETAVQAIERAFGELCRELAGAPTHVVAFEWGRNASPENLNQGYTHCFLVTFASAEGRDRYLPHPAHQAFCQDYLEAHLARVCVVDYLPQR